ncbi:MAG: LCP family protein [Oscillospiraceae bacterium]
MKGKHSKWWKIALISVAFLLVLAVMAGWIYTQDKLNRINYAAPVVATNIDADGGEAKPQNQRGDLFEDSTIHILLLGTDDSGEEFDDIARADAIMVLSADLEKNTLRLASLERGIGVPIPDQEKDWLTHVFAYGGADLMVETVNEQFDAGVERYVRVNFTGFEEIVDAIGGVEIDLTEAEVAALQPLTVADLEEGKNLLMGPDALQYARLRSIDSDFVRVQRQRTVMQAALDKMSDLSLVQIDQLLNKVLPHVETNFTKAELSQLLPYIPGFLGVEIDQRTIPDQEDILPGEYTSDGRLLTIIDFEQAADDLERFFKTGR